MVSSLDVNIPIAIIWMKDDKEKKGSKGDENYILRFSFFSHVVV
jgi:hypothetical protein